jgi:hypothetical protein
VQAIAPLAEKNFRLARIEELALLRGRGWTADAACKQLPLELVRVRHRQLREAIGKVQMDDHVEGSPALERSGLPPGNFIQSAEKGMELIAFGTQVGCLLEHVSER